MKENKNIMWYQYLNEYGSETTEKNPQVKNMMRKELKIQNDNIYERIGSYLEDMFIEFNEDIYICREIMKGVDDEKEMYAKCGMILRYKWSEEIALYLVNGILFEECNYFENTNEDDIMQWDDGKYYKRVLLDSEKKLKNKNLELKKRNLESEKRNLELEKRNLGN